MPDIVPNSYESTSWISNPFRTINNAIRRVITRRQASVKQAPKLDLTTELGTSASVSPRTEKQARLFIERYDRRSVILDVHKMQANDPLVAQACQVFVDTAVSKGFACSVEKTSARGTRAGTQNKAQRVIDRLVRESSMPHKIPSWGRMLLTEGDLFLQNVEYKGQLINVKRMPAVTMERMSDERDVFPNVLDAFHQLDIGTNEITGTFALWQITHGRWNFVDGERYGNSQYLQLRQASAQLLDMIEQMLIRRRARGPMRFFHQVGNTEHPGDWENVGKYMALNRLKDMDRRGDLDPMTDFFGNGVTSVSVLKGDERLGDIQDVEFVLNYIFPRTGIAKGLVGFGEKVSRDILDEQREFLYTQQDLLIDVLEWDCLRPSIDLALAMEGIDPDSIVYAIQFEERMTEAGKLARLEVLLEVFEAGLMTPEQFIQRAGPYIGVHDVQAYLDQLEEYKAEQQEKALAIGAANQGEQALEKSAKSAPGKSGASNISRITKKVHDALEPKRKGDRIGRVLKYRYGNPSRAALPPDVYAEENRIM
jgi:hypothetical protein